MKPLYNGMLPPSLVHRLADLWPDAAHVVIAYGETFPDRSVWAEARARLHHHHQRPDFADVDAYPGPPPRALGLAVGNATPDELEAHIREHAIEIAQIRASDERRRAIEPSSGESA